MPGNDLGDRVHNFFAQDNSLQGQHQSHVQGNWPVLNSNFWVGSPRQVDVLNSSSKSHHPQNLEVDRGQANYPIHASHGLNFSQSNLRPDISKSHYMNEQQYSNGVAYENQLYTNRQNEANFLGIDTDSNQRHLVSSRSLSFQEAQQGSGYMQQGKASDRLEASIAPVSFDLFGGQTQMNHQQASMLQALQRQQSGLNDMQQLQQQIMIRKIQEFQMQQQVKQLDSRPQDLVNQARPFSKQTSGGQSSNLVNDTSNSDVLWTAEPGTSWLSRGSSAMQAPPSGLVFPPELVQTQHLMDLVPQQSDQSLYGVPVSSSRGLAVNQYSQMVTDRSSMLQRGGQEGTSVGRAEYQNENMVIGHSSSQNTTDRGALQKANLMRRNAPQQHFAKRQGLATQSESSHEKPTRQLSSSPNEVPLDPTEEKILFGSDDNLWAAFGKSPNGEASNLMDNGGLSNGFASIQSGSWSALMQSAVAETSSTDICPQDEWSGLNIHGNDGSSANQPTSMHNDSVIKASLPDDIQIHSTLNAGSIRSSEKINTVNVMASDQFGHRLQNEPGVRVLTDSSQIFGRSLDEANKQLKCSPLQSVAGGVHGSSLNNNNESELSQKSQNNRLMIMQGGVHGSSLRKSSPIATCTELGPVKVGNHLEDKGLLSLNDGSASVANSYNTEVGDGTSSFVQISNVLNQWKSAYAPAKFQGSESWTGMQDHINEHNQGLDSDVRRRDMDSSSVKENSNDSHRSNLSQHGSGRFREAGLSDSSDSRLLLGKQKLTNQIANKVSVPRKFQYHPFVNSDEDMDPTFGLKQPTQVHSSSPQSGHFGQLSRVSRYSAVTNKDELPKDSKCTNEEPSRVRFPCNAPKMSYPLSRPLDSYMQNKASSPSEHMLELLHKVDQSRSDGAVTLSSFECNPSSHTPEAEKNDGSGCQTQHDQSSVPKGFGLQLGPPSQRLNISDVSLPSQNARDSANSMRISHAGAEVGEKMTQTSSASFSFPNEGSHYKNDRSAGPGPPGDENSMRKAIQNYHLAYSSDTPYEGSPLQNKQITIGNRKMTADEQIDSSFSRCTPYTTQRGYAETALPDSSHNIRKDKPFPYGVMAGTSDIQERDSILPNVWNSNPSSQNSFAAQFPKAPSHLSAPYQANIVESSFHDDLHVSKGDHLSSELNAINADSQDVVDDEEHSLKDNLENYPASPALNQKDMEAFGRSLKPNVFSSKNYASLNQTTALNDAQTDPSYRASKKIKGPDNIFFEDNVGNTLASSTGVPPQDVRMFSFSSSSDIMQRNTSSHGNVVSSDIVVAGPDASQSNPSDCTTPVRVQDHQVTSQMAPSWFNQHGSFKNAQMLPVYNAHDVTSLRPDEPPSTLNKSYNISDGASLEENSTASPSGAYHVGSSTKSAPSAVSNERLPSAYSSQLNVAGQYQLILRPQKRKTAPSELNPWHKEISDGSQNISLLSAAGDWNKAENHLSLTEKVQADAELVEDGSPLLRSRRRLILTTQLMHQLFRPPPPTILSVDGCSTYESVTYAVSRVVLGDACCLVTHSKDFGRRDCTDLHSMKGKLNDDHRFAKVIEGLLGKARKLDDDFLRLEKNALILDLRVECQDMEKFSVINRFAKFHGRGQTENPEASSSSIDATHNPFVQRYVTAVPIPRNLPDRVQCLSL